MPLTQRTTTQKNSTIPHILKDKLKIVGNTTTIPAKSTTQVSILGQSKPRNVTVLQKNTICQKPNNLLQKRSGNSAATTGKTVIVSKQPAVILKQPSVVSKQPSFVSKQPANRKPSTVTIQVPLKENISHSSKLIDTVIDIDAGDKNDPCLVTEYVLDIFNYLKTLEAQFKIEENYLVGHQTSARNRTILINWIVDICINFKFLAETLHLSVGILDRYLQLNKTVGSNTLQLVGVTALLIASKYEEIYVPDVSDFIFITYDSVTATDIFQTEIDILKKLEFNLGRPLSIHFLRRFCRIISPDIDRYNLAKYFLEIFLLDYNVCSILPSLQAAAALCLALYIFDDKANISLCWSKTLEHYSGYNYEDLNIHIMELIVAYYKMEKSKLHAIKKKYADPKLGNISKHLKLQMPKVMKLHETALTLTNH